MGRKRVKADERTVKFNTSLELSAMDLLESQAEERGTKPATLGREYLRTMIRANAAGSSPAGTPLSLSLNPTPSGCSPNSLSGVMLDQLCQPRDVVMFLQAAEGVIHIAAPWSRAKTISCVSVDVIRRTWAALDRVRREEDSGPHALGLRSAVSANLWPMQLCLDEMKRLRNPGQSRERVETTLALAENVLRAAADDILGVGEAAS